MPIPLIIILLILLGTYAYAGLKGAPWVPTKKKDVERFLRLAQIQPSQKMYDLGCGDARLVCEAAKAGAIAEGFELSLIPYFIAKVRQLFSSQRKNIRISFKDIWKVNLSDADLVYVFLMTPFYPRLKEKFLQELRPGTKIISYVWPLADMKPLTVDIV